MTKRTAWALLACITTIAATVAAVRGAEGLGVGVILGEPTGLSVKKWLSPGRAVDGAIAWSFSESSSLQLHADYLFHEGGFLRTQALEDKWPAQLYIGLGCRLLFKEKDKDDETRIGIRVPIGYAYLFKDAPVDAFVEFTPLFDVSPETRLWLNAAVGVRYYIR